MNRALAALVLLPALAACGTGRPRRGEEGAPKAVVLAAPGSRERAQEIARALNESLGWDVLLKVTTIPRTRSSVAVYGIGRAPERLEEVTDVLGELGIECGSEPGTIELLAFQRHATGGNAAVLWLGEDAQSFEASSPAISR